MKLVLAGMAPRDAAALGIFVGVSMKGWSCEAAAGRASTVLPAADAYVLDMAGLGLSDWSAHGEAQLLTLLKGRDAVLLVPPHNATWQDRVRGREGQTLVVLAKPYGSEAMRGALARLDGAPASTGTAPAPACQPQQPPAPRVMRPAAGADTASTAAPRARPPAAPPLPPMFASLLELRTVFPDLSQLRLLSTLLDALATGKPHELRLTLRHAIVMHPREGWVAHNALPGMLERLAVGGSALMAMSVRALDDAEAMERVRRIDSQRASLDAFLWHLAEASLGEQMPAPRRDTQLRLRGIPDFSRIPGVGNLYLQLSAICVRLPQTLASLRAAFPQQDPRLLSRFMLLSAVSGLGDLSPVEAGAGARLATRVPARTSDAPRAGFLRALLQKLF